MIMFRKLPLHVKLLGGVAVLRCLVSENDVRLTDPLHFSRKTCVSLIIVDS